ncbi:MAG: 4-(cytidine 5'-diphospho)-2-C-methyl-D-erythritol kinase [Planctomycetota bacterium]
MSSSSTIELFAPAKLNLCLEVLGRRPDGYHEIDSLVQAVDLCDRIRLERADAIHFEVHGEAPAGRHNLAWRAADLLGVGARIVLHKRIPPGSGLGGGSSDAAAVLHGLNRLYGLGHAPAALAEMGARLGADVPFFLHGGAARCRGVGERVEPLPDPPPGTRFLLLLPPVRMETKRVYGALQAPLTGSPEVAKFFSRIYFGKEGPLRAPFFNRLQEVAEGLEPRLGRLRREAETACGAAFTMTGSGSAYFAAWGTGDSPLGDRWDARGLRCRLQVVRALGSGEASSPGGRCGHH